MAAKKVRVAAESSCECVLHMCRLDSSIAVSLINTEREIERRIIVQDVLEAGWISHIERVVCMASNRVTLLDVRDGHTSIL